MPMKNKLKKALQPNLVNLEVSCLTMKDLNPGQILLGCIFEVGECELIIDLPHKIFGYVPITNISADYSKMLPTGEESETMKVRVLTELYRPGQFIVVQVVATVAGKSGKKVMLSIEPNAVNKSLASTPLCEGDILQCAIRSSEEKGWIIDTGLPWVRGAFLQKKLGKKYFGVGHVFIAVIKSATPLDGSKEYYNIKISALETDIMGNAMELKNSPKVPFSGAMIPVKIQKTQSNGLQVKCSIGEGVIHTSHLIKPYDSPSEYVVGSTINARVLYVTPITNIIHFTLNPCVCTLGNGIGNSNKRLGDVIQNAQIFKSHPTCVAVKLPDQNVGVCGRQEFDGKQAYSAKDFKIGKQKACRIIKFWVMDQVYDISFSEKTITQQVVCREELKVGKYYDAEILTVTEAGASVSLADNVKAFIPAIHLRNSSLSDKIKAGQKIQALMCAFKKCSFPYLTIREELLAQEKHVASFDESLQSSKVGGIVFSKPEKGCYIGFFDGAKGFLPLASVSRSHEERYESLQVGDYCECYVAKIWNPKKARLTMEDPNAPPDRKRKRSVSPSATEEEASPRKSRKKNVPTTPQKENDVEMKEATPSMETPGPQLKEKKKESCASHVDGGTFQWDVHNILMSNENHSTDDDDSDEDNESNKKKVQRYQKKLRAEQEHEEERALRQREAERLDPLTQPQSVEDFECLMQKDRNSSQHWIQYICFHLENSESEKAIATGDRALQTIDITKEQERLNVWNVLLKMELKYHNKNAFDKRKEMAIRCNNPLKIYPLVVENLHNENHSEEASQILKKFLKKNSKEVQAWLWACEFYFRHQMLDMARALLEKAKLSLPAKKHLELSSKVGLFEFRLGDPEKAKTIFEDILNCHPKRLDLWMVYSDALLKNSDVDAARHVLERASGLGLKPNKMSAVFKKMYALEEKHGTAASIEIVTNKIAKYVKQYSYRGFKV